MPIIENFEKLLAAGQDSALLRFSLGQAYLNKNQYDKAIEHLRRATQHDINYSAAWKLLGKALAAANQITEALKTYQQGIEIAEAKGDVQAAKEMKVFLKRLQKTPPVTG
ncbi:MAG: tetratricopeptide repeat protein [Gammaproteobacteria bacterium]|nr:tetratricopeptide repeat protein [Gammaproteobacteria bacterium]